MGCEKSGQRWCISNCKVVIRHIQTPERSQGLKLGSQRFERELFHQFADSTSVSGVKFVHIKLVRDIEGILADVAPKQSGTKVFRQLGNENAERELNRGQNFDLKDLRKVNQRLQQHSGCHSATYLKLQSLVVSHASLRKACGVGVRGSQSSGCYQTWRRGVMYEARFSTRNDAKHYSL
jgi:hypothetical protein